MPPASSSLPLSLSLSLSLSLTSASAAPHACGERGTGTGGERGARGVNHAADGVRRRPTRGIALEPIVAQPGRRHPGRTGRRGAARRGRLQEARRRAGGGWPHQVHSRYHVGCLKRKSVSTSRVSPSGALAISCGLFEAQGRFHLPCESIRSTLNVIWACGHQVDAAVRANFQRGGAESRHAGGAPTPGGGYGGAGGGGVSGPYSGVC
jgi:hypothetical protein